MWVFCVIVFIASYMVLTSVCVHMSADPSLDHCTKSQFHFSLLLFLPFPLFPLLPVPHSLLCIAIFLYFLLLLFFLLHLLLLSFPCFSSPSFSCTYSLCAIVTSSLGLHII